MSRIIGCKDNKNREHIQRLLSFYLYALAFHINKTLYLKFIKDSIVLKNTNYD